MKSAHSARALCVAAEAADVDKEWPRGRINRWSEVSARLAWSGERLSLGLIAQGDRGRETERNKAKDATVTRESVCMSVSHRAS